MTMDIKVVFVIVQASLCVFWLGVWFAVIVLDLAPSHDPKHCQRTALFNASVFGVVGGFMWWSL